MEFEHFFISRRFNVKELIHRLEVFECTVGNEDKMGEDSVPKERAWLQSFM
jgi:hypothetical protein